MSGEGKYISLYYNLVHQSASDFYKEISKGPNTNMSYLPSWVSPAGAAGGHYPPHMIPQQQPVTSHSAHPGLNSSPIGSPSHMYSNLTPATKPQPNNLMHSQSNSSPKHVQSSIPSLSPTGVHTNTTTSHTVTQAAAAAAAATAAAVAAAVAASAGNVTPLTAHTHNSNLEHYQSQAFGHRPMSPTSKAHADIKSEIAGLHGLPELALGLAGPSAFDAKGHRKYVRSRSPGKYPAPEQLSAPVMFSYQGRGRPRKHFTHGTGLPTMVPVTHPSATSADDGEDEENKPFKCHVCCKGFKLKGGLQQHERTHSTDRPYVCPDCGKLFRQPTHLQQHMRIHTGEKPYDCSFCDKSFRQRTILNQHLRIHTGEKPYICMECGKQFRQKAILDQHYRTHLGEKPYACPHPTCRKHFREMASLISHMKCHKDVPDPKMVFQQAKRLIKEEKLDEFINHDSNAIGSNNNLGGSDVLSVPHPSSVNHENSSSERDHPTPRYLNNGEHINRAYPSPTANQQRSPHSVHHQPTSNPPSNESQALSGAMMASPPQMAMANLIPYPHSIFPATSYMMTTPDHRLATDPRQYHQMASSVSQASPIHSRPGQ